MTSLPSRDLTRHCPSARAGRFKAVAFRALTELADLPDKPPPT
jgi:hypothetical protein